MDKTDMILIQLLLQNSRRPYRELADTLNLSVNAAHKRIHELIESGILRTFTAKINLSAFEKAVSVWVWGRSEAKSLDEIITKLGKDSSGSNDQTLNALLRNVTTHSIRSLRLRVVAPSTLLGSTIQCI